MKRTAWIGVCAAVIAMPALAQESGFQGLRVDSARTPAPGGFGFRLGAAGDPAPAFRGTALPSLASPEIARGDWPAGSARLAAAPGSLPRNDQAFIYSPEAGALMDYRFSRWTITSSLRQGLGERSTAFDVGARYGFSLAPRHGLALLGSVGLGNHSAVRPLATNELDILRMRPPGLGFRDVGAQFSLLYTFDQSWYVNTTLGYARLLGDQADAGTPDRNVTSVGAFFGYRF